MSRGADEELKYNEETYEGRGNDNDQVIISFSSTSK